MTWDVIKDVVLWVYLYNRIGFLLESIKVDVYFVVCLIWFNLGTILFAQCMMGTYILQRANKIITIAESVRARVVLYCILVLMLPFVPCILLLQVSNIASKESEHVLQWHEISSSPSFVARAVITIRKEKAFVTNTYAHLRLLEGVCESFPQIVLLLAYFFVTIVDPNSLSISDDISDEISTSEFYNDDYSSRIPFFHSFHYHVNFNGTLFFILNILLCVHSPIFPC